MTIPDNLPLTYNYCKICGHSPTSKEPMNVTCRFWDADDGWVIGALCRWCYEDYGNAQPHPDDYAYRMTNGICDEEETDEDIIGIIDNLFDI